MCSRAAHVRPPQVTIYPPAPSRIVFGIVELLLRERFARSTDLSWKILELKQSIFYRQDGLRLIEMHLRFERKIPQSADTNIDQAERRMIHANVAAAFRAITTIADVAAFELAEELIAVRDLDLIRFRQRERADRRRGITPAILAMTVTRLQRFAAHLDLHRSAITSAFMCVSHDEDIQSGSQEPRKI